MSRILLPLPRNTPKSRDLYGEIKVEKSGKIFNKTENTIQINGVIDDWFGVSAEEVEEALQELDESQPLLVKINSPGGLVFEAIAIHNLIAEWPAEVITHITSRAMSSATFIYLVGDKRTIADNAEFMVHHPWTIALGNSGELRGVADHLDRTAEKMIDMYERKSNLSRNEITDLLNGPENQDGTYLDAQETLDAGFATEIIDTSRTADEGKTGQQDLLNSMPRRRMLAKIELA